MRSSQVDQLRLGVRARRDATFERLGVTAQPRQVYKVRDIGNTHLTRSNVKSGVSSPFSGGLTSNIARIVVIRMNNEFSPSNFPGQILASRWSATEASMRGAVEAARCLPARKAKGVRRRVERGVRAVQEALRDERMRIVLVVRLEGDCPIPTGTGKQCVSQAQCYQARCRLGLTRRSASQSSTWG